MSAPTDPTLPPSRPAEASSETLPPGSRPSAVGAADARAPEGYVIERELGRGGMGVVYLARSLALDRLCALKVILSGAHGGDEEAERFRTEARAIARVRHPGIVQVYEVGEHEGRPYMALEFCAGGSLHERLRENPLAPREAAEVVRQLAEAVQAAHEAKVVHRDLKPANVLLANPPAHAGGSPALVKVTDFGLAKKLDDESKTVSGAVMGTPSYMSPEQARGSKDVGPLADVYSLGAILYECLVGRPPFKAATAYDTVLQAVSEEPVPPRQLNAKVPRDLETVALKCLAKSSGARYASARDLADDLGRFLAGEPIRARPVGVAERAAKWVRRNKAVSALAASVLIVLAVGASVSSWMAYHAWDRGNLLREALGESRQRESAEASAKQDASEKAERAARAEKAALDAKAQAEGREKAEAVAKAEARQETKRAEAEKARAEAEKARAEASLRRAEGLVYAVKLALAQSTFAEGNGSVSLDYLDECQWDLRGWEHRHLWTRFNARQTLRGHSKAVSGVAWSPDGKRIATASLDKTVKVFDAEKGAELFALKGHASGVSSVAFSPDGKRVLAGCWDGMAKVWDAEKGAELLALKCHKEAVRGVAWSPDGTRILTGSFDKSAKVFDAEKGAELYTLEGHSREVSSVAWSLDDKRILTGSLDNTAKVWDAVKGTGIYDLVAHTSAVWSVAWSPDGGRILTGSLDKTAKVWDAATRAEIHTLQHTREVSSVAYSPDGKRILTGSHDGTARVWDALEGRQVLTLKGHEGVVSSVAWSPDGTRILTGGADTTARVFDAETGTESFTLGGHTSWVTGVAFSPDGRRILTGSYDGTARAWDARTGQEVISLEGHAGNVYGVAWSPDGTRILTGSSDKTAKVWDALFGPKSRRLEGHRNWVTSVRFGPDGRLFAWDEQGKVLAWSVADGKPVAADGPPARPSAGPARSPDGHLVANARGISVLVSDADRPADAKPWPLPDAAERQRHHAEQAALAERQGRHFACAFHLGRLLLDAPDDAALKRRRDAALKRHAGAK